MFSRLCFWNFSRQLQHIYYTCELESRAICEPNEAIKGSNSKKYIRIQCWHKLLTYLDPVQWSSYIRVVSENIQSRIPVEQIVRRPEHGGGCCNCIVCVECWNRLGVWLKSGKFREGSVEFFADRLVFLLLSQKFVCLAKNETLMKYHLTVFKFNTINSKTIHVSFCITL